MRAANLEERVAELEKQVALLIDHRHTYYNYCHRGSVDGHTGKPFQIPLEAHGSPAKPL